MEKYLNSEDEQAYIKSMEDDKNWFSRFTQKEKVILIEMNEDLPPLEAAKKMIKIKNLMRRRSSLNRRFHFKNEEDVLLKFGDSKEFMVTLNESNCYCYDYVGSIKENLGKDFEFLKSVFLNPIYKDDFYKLNIELHTDELIDWLLDNEYKCVGCINKKFLTDERVLKEIEFNIMAAKNLSDKLKDDENVVRKLIEQTPYVLNIVSPRLLKDKEFILSFNNLESLLNVDVSVYQDKDFVHKVINKYGERIFGSLPENIQSQYAREILKKSPYTIFYHLTDEMIKDTDLLLELVDKIEGDDFLNCSIVSYSMNRILENPDFNRVLEKHQLRRPGISLSFLGESTLFQVAAFLRKELYKEDINNINKDINNINKDKLKVKKF